MATRLAAERQPEDLVRRWPLVLIDEVQRVPNLLLAVKAAVDEEQQRTKGRFVLTGSANVLAMHQMADSPAGRAGYMEIAPMTRTELLGFGTTGRWSDRWAMPFEEWHAALSASDSIPGDWRETAIHGGFPVPSLQLNNFARPEWFRGYVQTYLERDLRSVSAIDSLGEFQLSGSTMVDAAVRCCYTEGKIHFARRIAFWQSLGGASYDAMLCHFLR